MAEAGQTLLLHSKPALSGHRMTCTPYRRWPFTCTRTCAFPEEADNGWPCHAPCHGVKNHEGAHLCYQHWEVNPDDWDTVAANAGTVAANDLGTAASTARGPPTQ